MKKRALIKRINELQSENLFLNLKVAQLELSMSIKDEFISKVKCPKASEK